jgi:prevent-host-death family protein
METVNINEARKHLSRLVEKAAKGEPFIIAKNGKPMVKVVPIDTSTQKPTKRFGFLKGKISVPDDFDTLYQKEIEEMFCGGDIEP